MGLDFARGPAVPRQRRKRRIKPKATGSSSLDARLKNLPREELHLLADGALRDSARLYSLFTDGRLAEDDQRSLALVDCTQHAELAAACFREMVRRNAIV